MPGIVSHGAHVVPPLVNVVCRAIRPALGGRTPLEAVGTADGKEIVESLLLQWERQNENIDDPTFFLPDVNAVRRLLKLNPSAT